jgi:hypothetical protein
VYDNPIRNSSRVLYFLYLNFNSFAADWNEKAVRDAEHAFAGVLKAEGYVLD